MSSVHSLICSISAGQWREADHHEWFQPPYRCPPRTVHPTPGTHQPTDHIGLEVISLSCSLQTCFPPPVSKLQRVFKDHSHKSLSLWEISCLLISEHIQKTLLYVVAGYQKGNEAKAPTEYKETQLSWVIKVKCKRAWPGTVLDHRAAWFKCLVWTRLSVTAAGWTSRRKVANWPCPSCGTLVSGER